MRIINSDTWCVLQRAKEIVKPPPTDFGYSDVGDVLVSYLRGDKNYDEAMQTLNGLDEDYAKRRART